MIKKRNYKPEEVDAMLQKMRDLEWNTEKEEAIIISSIVASAKRNGRYGDKILMVIPPHYVHIPIWQRKCDIEKANRIGLEYKSSKWELPKIILCNGKLICSDGMHRIVGAHLGHIDNVTVELLDITEHDAIEEFLHQTADRTRMSTSDYLNASLQIKIPEYVMMQNICHKYNVVLKGEDPMENSIGIFTSLRDGVNLCKFSPKTFESMIKLIAKLQWSSSSNSTYYNKAFGSKYIRVLKKLYAYYSEHHKELEQVLLKECKGIEWFENNALDITQAKLFDNLAAMIEAKINSTKPQLKAV